MTKYETNFERIKTGVGRPTIMENEIGFKPEQMIACVRCGKSNAPNRLRCLYCDTELDLSEASVPIEKLLHRKLEIWEKGFNVICRPGRTVLDKSVVEEVSRLIGFDLPTDHIDSDTAMPLARVETERDAEQLILRLGCLGLTATAIADETLVASRPPVRLQALEFGEREIEFVTFNNSDIIRVDSTELILIVTGSIFESRVETFEKRGKRGIKKLNEMLTSSDEKLFDIYLRNDKIGYRIPMGGFDFTCLGENRSLLAAENIRRMADRLRSFAPNVRFVDDYLDMRVILNAVWDVEYRKESLGLRRAGFGRVEFANTESSSNLMQFTKYSRLQTLVQ